MAQNATENSSDEFLVFPSFQPDVAFLKKLERRAPIDKDPTRGPQLKMIPATPPDGSPPATDVPFDPNTDELYRLDDSSGVNQWIYIINTVWSCRYLADISKLIDVSQGFDTSIPDLQANGREVTTFVVPPSFTLSESIPIDRRGPTDISDIGDRDASTNTFRGHGTGVASAAGGLEYGVTPRANLHLIKGKGSFCQPRGEGLTSHVAAGYTHQAIERAFGHIQGHYFGLRTNNGVTRAVINLSWGIARQDGAREVNRDSELGRLFDKFLSWAVDNDIVVVCAAGNFGRSAEQQVRKCLSLLPSFVVFG